jgi:hypothetical protein
MRTCTTFANFYLAPTPVVFASYCQAEEGSPGTTTTTTTTYPIRPEHQSSEQILVD